VEEKHPEDAVDVDGARGVFSERERIEADVPGVLGRVLGPRAVVERGAAQDRLQAVGLGEEVELRREPAFGHRVDSPSLRVT
jgi:hypothetical protein